MNVLDLTPNQLKRAASIKEQINRLNGELVKLLGGASTEGDGKRNGRLSSAARARIAAAQRSRWAKARKAKAGKPIVKSALKKSTMSAAARARVSAGMKKFWKAKKAGKKTASKGK